MSDEEDDEDHASHHHHHHYHPPNEDNDSVDSASYTSANLPATEGVDDESVTSRGKESCDGSTVSFQANHIPVVEILSDDLEPQEFTDVALNQHPGATFLSGPQHDRMIEFDPHLHHISEKDSLDSHRNRIMGITPNARQQRPRLEPCPDSSSHSSLKSTDESSDTMEHKH